MMMMNKMGRGQENDDINIFSTSLLAQQAWQALAFYDVITCRDCSDIQCYLEISTNNIAKIQRQRHPSEYSGNSDPTSHYEIHSKKPKYDYSTSTVELWLARQYHPAWLGDFPLQSRSIIPRPSTRLYAGLAFLVKIHQNLQQVLKGAYRYLLQ